MLEFLLSITAGYKLAKAFSHPESKIRKKIPYIKFKFIQISPNIKIYLKGKIIHLHHWIFLSIILILTFKSNFFVFDSFILKGMLSGGIIQGFTFSDWKRIVSRLKEGESKEESKQYISS